MHCIVDIVVLGLFYYCTMYAVETVSTTMAPLDISTTTTEGNPTSIVSLSNGGLSNEVERNQKLVKERTLHYTI